MGPDPRWIKSGVLCASFLAAFAADSANADGCATEGQPCLSSVSFQNTNFGLIEHKRPQPSVDSAAKSQNVTISTRGARLVTKRYVFESTADLALPKDAAPVSKLRVETGENGELGDLALSVNKGGRIALDMDVERDYLKVRYIFDF